MQDAKTNEKNRSWQISYRLTKAEYLPLQEVAEQTGESVNDLARRLALNGKIEPPPFRGFRPDPAVVMRLNGIGVSLRNIEAACKNSQPLPPELTAEVGQLMARIAALVDAAVEERVEG